MKHHLQVFVPGGPLTPEMELARAERRFVMTMAVIRGCADAQELIADIRGAHAHPEAVLDAIRAAGTGDRLVGLARQLQRELQKAIVATGNAP